MEQSNHGKGVITYRYFVPFFVGGFIFVVTVIFLSKTSLERVFNKIYKENLVKDIYMTKKIINDKRHGLEIYSKLMGDSNDLRNALYYASDELINIKNPLEDMISFYYNNLRLDFIVAFSSDGKKLYSMGHSHDKIANLSSGSSSDEVFRLLSDKSLSVLKRSDIYMYKKKVGKVVIGTHLNKKFFEDIKKLTGNDFIVEVRSKILFHTIETGKEKNILKEYKRKKHIEWSNKSFILSDFSIGNDQNEFSLYIIKDISNFNILKKNTFINIMHFLIMMAIAVFVVGCALTRRVSLKINNLFLQNNNYQKKLQRQESLVSVGKAMSQVAHDIRSPLISLEMLLPSIAKLDEGTRIIARSSILRIKDIANDLLEKRDSIEKKIKMSKGINSKSHFVFLILESIISEKRIMLHGGSKVQFNLLEAHNPYSIFTDVDMSCFKRVLSNILNNSIEANSDCISIELVKNSGYYTIKILDNGEGMSEKVLKKIKTGNISLGKKGGHGLGLDFSRKMITEWKGFFDIKSNIDKGTEVLITLPTCPNPSWYIPYIVLKPITIILDDDESIHQVWNSRFKNNNTKLYHFYNSQDLFTWYEENKEKKLDFLFLSDYELINEKINGIEIIKKINAISSSFLVTSRYEENAVLDLCLSDNIKLMPKPMAFHVEIKNKISSYKIVHIDDNPSVRLSWELAAESKEINILSLSSPQEFYVFEQYCDKEKTKFYIDINFKNSNIDGIKFSELLSRKGFKNLYLSTGCTKDDVIQPVWIKGFLNKECPF